MCMKSRCQSPDAALNRSGSSTSWPTDHRPHPPRGRCTLASGPLVRLGRTAKPLRCALHSHSLSFTLSRSRARQSKATAPCHRHRAPPCTQCHHPIHLAHNSATISSTSLTRQCHHLSQGKATLCIAVAAMATERHQAPSSPWPTLSTTPPTSFSHGSSLP